MIQIVITRMIFLYSDKLFKNILMRYIFYKIPLCFWEVRKSFVFYLVF